MDNFFTDLFAAFWQPVASLLRAFSPLFTGLALAYLFNGPAEWVRVKLLKRTDDCLSTGSPKGRALSLVITYLLAFLLVCAVFYTFAVLILGSFPAGGLSEVLPQMREYFSSASREIGDFLAQNAPEGLFSEDFDPLAALCGRLRRHFSADSLLSSLSALASGAANFFIGLVASVYLLKDKEFFLSLWQKLLSLLLPQDVHGRVNETLAEINQVLTTFIKGAACDSLVVALLSSFALSALGVRYAAALGILCGLLNVIPYFGPVLGMAPAFMAAFFFGGLQKAVAAAALLVVIQQVDSNYVYPKIVGRSIGLHPLFVLLALTVLGRFFGILGMLLAVPAAGILQILVRRWVEKR